MTQTPGTSTTTSAPSLSQAEDATPGRPLVSVRGLTKTFGDHRVLKSIDFEVPVGTVTVLIGPSGSGKTTVLRSLNVLETPDTGVIRIGDVEADFSTAVTKRQMKALRAQSGMVFQAHNLFPHMKVLQNITAGPILVQHRNQADADSDAMQLLRIVGLAEKADQYPYQLSGGQQQRVGIARALAIKPHLILFDEPTSSLDPELVGEVLEAMKDLATQGWTMVVVTHEIRFAQQVADQVLFMDDGIIVERGTPAQVLTAPSSQRARQFLRRLLDPI